MSLINGCYRCTNDTIPTNLVVKELVFNYLGSIDTDTYLTDTIIEMARDAADKANEAADEIEELTTTVNNRVSEVEDSQETTIQRVDNFISTDVTPIVQNAIRGVAIDANLITDALVPIMPIASGASSRTQLDKNRENVSILDFFTVEEMAAYSADTTFDAARPLQAFFDYISVNNVSEANVNGVFSTTLPIIFGNSTGILTKQVTGNLTLRATAEMETLFTIYSGGELNWLGTLRLIGNVRQGADTFARRGTKIGLLIGGKHISSRNTFNSIVCSTFSECGILADQLSTLTNLGDVRTTNCGSGVAITGYSHQASFNARVDIEPDSGVKQRSVLTVSELPPDISKYPTFIRIDEDYHYIYGTDEGDSTITVYPWLKAETLSGEFTYVYGGGVVIRGGDASVLKAAKIDAKRCGMGLVDGALYGAVVDNLVNQYCGVGYAVGLYPAAAHVGGQINGIYCENNHCDILKVSGSIANTYIASEYALNLAKVNYIAPYSNGYTDRVSYNNLSGFLLNIGGQVYSYENLAYNRIASKVNVLITGASRVPYTVTANSTTVRLIKPNANYHKAFGIQYREVIVFGSGSNQAPTGTITLEAVGEATLNGGTVPISFSNFKEAARFAVFYDFVNDNFKVSIPHVPNKGVLTAQNKFDLPAIVPGARTSVELTVPGAAYGNVVTAGYLGNLQGLEMWGSVTAPGIVTVYLVNNTAESVTLPRDFFSVEVRPNEAMPLPV